MTMDTFFLLKVFFKPIFDFLVKKLEFVQGGQIDISLHENKARKSFEELIEFDQAIGTAAGLVDLEKTLLVTTADHSHNLNLAGYANRNASVLGETNSHSNALFYRLNLF